MRFPRDPVLYNPLQVLFRMLRWLAELKTSAKYKQKEHTQTLKSQKQKKMTRKLEQQDRDERQNQHAQIYTPTNYPHTRALA